MPLSTCLYLADITSLAQGAVQSLIQVRLRPV